MSFDFIPVFCLGLLKGQGKPRFPEPLVPLCPTKAKEIVVDIDVGDLILLVISARIVSVWTDW